MKNPESIWKTRKTEWPVTMSPVNHFLSSTACFLSPRYLSLLLILGFQVQKLILEREIWRGGRGGKQRTMENPIFLTLHEWIFQWPHFQALLLSSRLRPLPWSTCGRRSLCPKLTDASSPFIHSSREDGEWLGSEKLGQGYGKEKINRFFAEVHLHFHNPSWASRIHPSHAKTERRDGF